MGIKKRTGRQTIACHVTSQPPLVLAHSTLELLIFCFSDNQLKYLSTCHMWFADSFSEWSYWDRTGYVISNRGWKYVLISLNTMWSTPVPPYPCTPISGSSGMIFRSLMCNEYRPCNHPCLVSKTNHDCQFFYSLHPFPFSIFLARNKCF